jgi:hypothetical protein
MSSKIRNKFIINKWVNERDCTINCDNEGERYDRKHALDIDAIYNLKLRKTT